MDCGLPTIAPSMLAGGTAGIRVSTSDVTSYNAAHQRFFYLPRTSQPTPNNLKFSKSTITMPREMRKRGRRAEKKRKTESNVLSKPTAPTLENLYIEDVDGAVAVDDTTTFYGLLTEEEQEYFKRTDEMLALDQFGDADGALRDVRVEDEER
jgi:hypothetical protein